MYKEQHIFLIYKIKNIFSNLKNLFHHFIQGYF